MIDATGVVGTPADVPCASGGLSPLGYSAAHHQPVQPRTTRQTARDGGNPGVVRHDFSPFRPQARSRWTQTQQQEARSITQKRQQYAP